MTNANIYIRYARKEDASAVARLIMVAMSEECCRYFYGERHTSEEFHDMMTALVERKDTQYSYENTICSTDANDNVVGIVVCYDGGKLHELRKAFIDEVRHRFERDFNDMDDETESGELYIDSLAVAAECRGYGIAKRLLDAAEERAVALGIKHLGLLMEKDNNSAERVYARQGFKAVGERCWGGHRLEHLQKRI